MFKRFAVVALVALLAIPALFFEAEADKRVYNRTLLTYACTDSQPTFLPEVALRTRDAQGRAYLKLWVRFKADAQDLGGTADFRVKFLPSWSSAIADTNTFSLPYLTPGLAAPVFTSFVVDSAGVSQVIELVPNDIPAQSGLHLFPPYLWLMVAEGFTAGTVQVDYSALYED